MQVILSEKASREFRRLPKPDQSKIKIRLTLLKDNPLAGKKLEGKLKNDRSLRAWPYRIIYSSNKKMNRVEVSGILHRKESYKN